jgi:hypothetical protein
MLSDFARVDLPEPENPIRPYEKGSFSSKLRGFII